jgi:hypothetical protein
MRFQGYGGLPSAGELKHRLAEICEQVCQAALPDCRFEGGELRGHAASDGALWKVATRGRKRGLALNTADPDQSGDLLDLVTNALCGGDRRAGYRWALQFVDGAVSQPVAIAAPLARDPEAAAAVDAERRKQYWGWYQRALPGPGSPRDAYLAGRGLTRELIALPECLRFFPRCRYVFDEKSRMWTHRPAMLAPITDPLSGEFRSLHATYLEPTAGGWRKVSSKPARKCWGSISGGVIELSVVPLREAPEGAGCLIGEGIENVLSAALVRPELLAVAGISVNNLPKIMLPPQIALVVLAIDDDGEKTQLAAVLEKAIDRWRREGRGAETMVPLRGLKDWNEQLQKAAWTMKSCSL